MERNVGWARGLPHPGRREAGSEGGVRALRRHLLGSMRHTPRPVHDIHSSALSQLTPFPQPCLAPTRVVTLGDMSFGTLRSLVKKGRTIPLPLEDCRGDALG